MRFDGSDVSSLGVIAFGSVVGLLGTGVVLARADASEDTRIRQVIEVPAPPTDPTTEELLRARPRIRLQPRIRTQVDLRDGPVIFIDGVRLGVAANPGEVLDDLDPNEVERVTVLRSGAGGRSDAEIRIELKPR